MQIVDHHRSKPRGVTRLAWLLPFVATGLVAACTVIEAKPSPSAVTGGGAPTHGVVLLPTADERDDATAGVGVDVFGHADTHIRTADGLSRHVDDLLARQLAAQGVVIAEGDASLPTVQVQIKSVSLRRDPGAITARYRGRAGITVVLTRPSGRQELPMIAVVEHQGSGLRLLEPSVFDALLTATLEEVGRKGAASVAAALRAEPPPPLG